MWPFKKKNIESKPCQDPHKWRFVYETRQGWGYRSNGEHFGQGRTIESLLTTQIKELRTLMETWKKLGYNGVHTSIKNFRCIKCGARLEEEYYEPYIISPETLANAKKRLEIQPITVKIIAPKVKS